MNATKAISKNSTKRFPTDPKTSLSNIEKLSVKGIMGFDYSFDPLVDSIKNKFINQKTHY